MPLPQIYVLLVLLVPLTLLQALVASKALPPRQPTALLPPHLLV